MYPADHVVAQDGRDVFFIEARFWMAASLSFRHDRPWLPWQIDALDEHPVDSVAAEQSID